MHGTFCKERNSAQQIGTICAVVFPAAHQPAKRWEETEKWEQKELQEKRRGNKTTEGKQERGSKEKAEGTL